MVRKLAESYQTNKLLKYYRLKRLLKVKDKIKYIFLYKY